MKPGVPLFITLVAACGGGNRPAPNRPAYASVDDALASVLAVDTSWHIGTNADCTNPSLKEMLSDNSSYHAYEATTDVDGDRHPDHLFALVKGDSGKFYWIPGRDEGFDVPRLFATVNWVREGGFIAQDGTVVFGRFYSDVSETWKWSPVTGRLDLVPQDSTSER